MRSASAFDQTSLTCASAVSAFVFECPSGVSWRRSLGPAPIANQWQAADGVKAWRIGDEDRAIRLYLGVALVVAIALGWTMGDINFWQFMQPCYHVDHLATYSNVNPSSQHLWSGEQAPSESRVPYAAWPVLMGGGAGRRSAR